MKGTRVSLAVLSIAALGMLIPNENRIFRGEIMDSFCAEMGSHETVTTSVRNDRDCTLDCVKAGARFVLYNPNHNEPYKLDDQRAPRIFAGEKVRIIGTYNSATNTIHVVDIQPTVTESLKQFASSVRQHFVRP